jgi:site-specific recombinase XerD
MIEFSIAARKFLSHQQMAARITKGYTSPNTQRTYGKVFAKFQRYLDAQGKLGLEAITLDVLRSYLGQLREQGLADASISLQRTTLRSFFKWAASNYKHITNQGLELEPVRIRRSEAAHLTREQLSNFLGYLWKDRKARKRDAVLFELMARTGARVSEICSLDMESVRISETAIAITLRGKGNKDRTITIPISPDTEPVSTEIKKFKNKLEDYASRRRRIKAHEPHVSALFLTNYRNRVRPRNIQGAFDYYRRKLNLSAMSPHSLRHTCLTHLLQQGVDIATVSRMAGHASPQVTLNVYAHTDKSKLEEAASKAFV